MTTRLIGISGRKGVGKSTVAAMLQAALPLPFEQKMYADPLKRIVSTLTGCTLPQLEDQDFKMQPSPIPKPEGGYYTFRELLQRVGTEFGRNVLHPNVWVDALFSSYTRQSRWLITDLRFVNEAEAVERRGGIVLRIEREGLPRDTHPSETALDGYEFDYTICNNGTLADLKNEVRLLVENILD